MKIIVDTDMKTGRELCKLKINFPLFRIKSTIINPHKSIDSRRGNGEIAELENALVELITVSLET